MYKNNKLLIGKNGDKELGILPSISKRAAQAQERREIAKNRTK